MGKKSTRGERNKHNRFVVIYDDKMLDVNKTMNKHLHTLYGNSGVVLTVGDGDFSFSLALAMQLPMRLAAGGSRLVATSYDSLGQLLDKYPACAVTLDTLKSMGCSTLHSIDGCSLNDSITSVVQRASGRPGFVQVPEVLHKCSRVIFNFPHLGGNNADAIKMNRDMLSGFFFACREMLLPAKKGANQRNSSSDTNAALLSSDMEDATYGGQVHVTLRNTVFYENWNITELALTQGFRCLKKQRFNSKDYPGYQEQRTNPAVMRALPPSADGSNIYIFVVDPSLTPAGKPESLVSPANFGIKRKRDNDGEEEPEDDQDSLAAMAALAGFDAEEAKSDGDAVVLLNEGVKTKYKVKLQTSITPSARTSTQVASSTKVPMYLGKPVTFYAPKTRNYRLGLLEEVKRLKALGIDVKQYSDEEIVRGITQEEEEDDEEVEAQEEQVEDEDEEEESEEEENEEEESEEESEEEETVFSAPVIDDGDDDGDDFDFNRYYSESTKPVVAKPISKPVIKPVVKPVVTPAPKPVVMKPVVDAPVKTKTAVVTVAAPKTVKQVEQPKKLTPEEKKNKKRKVNPLNEVVKNYTDSNFTALDVKSKVVNNVFSIDMNEVFNARNTKVMERILNSKAAKSDGERSAPRETNSNQELFEVVPFVSHKDQKPRGKRGGRNDKGERKSNKPDMNNGKITSKKSHRYRG